MRAVFIIVVTTAAVLMSACSDSPTASDSSTSITTVPSTPGTAGTSDGPDDRLALGDAISFTDSEGNLRQLSVDSVTIGAPGDVGTTGIDADALSGFQLMSISSTVDTFTDTEVTFKASQNLNLQLADGRSFGQLVSGTLDPCEPDAVVAPGTYGICTVVAITDDTREMQIAWTPHDDADADGAVWALTN